MLFNFEEIAKDFERYYKIASISHCDELKIEEDKNSVLLVEKTCVINQDLLNSKKYRKQLEELVKKMWGSLVILIWYDLQKSNFTLNSSLVYKRKRIFKVVFEIERKNAKFLKGILPQLRDDLLKYKNGAYNDIEFYFRIIWRL